MYYIGAMQIVISKIAWVMRVSLGTTAAESLCAAGNIFIGQVTFYDFKLKMINFLVIWKIVMINIKMKEITRKSIFEFLLFLRTKYFNEIYN